jgi:hypothetical protein
VTIEPSADMGVVDAIAELRALAQDSSTPYHVLVEKVHVLMAFAPMSIASFCTVGQELYRGTSYHTSVPLLQSEISYPPANSVGFNRANCPGRPMFYCSPDPNAVFWELRSRVGQYAVLAKWVAVQRGALHGIG